MEPLFDIVEGLIIGHVIDNNDTVGSSVVGRGDGAETFLSSGIPDLKLDCLTVQLNCTDFKINTNGRDVRLRVSIISKPKEKTRFTNTRVSDKKKFEEIIVFWIHIGILLLLQQSG
mmetsp:Transcript_21254/g.46125  ORF Transcript_21254/g.46125 Transcript_21254/m.46125 type:complete len:116 (+) Transcript_21254:571-918(+)